MKELFSGPNVLILIGGTLSLIGAFWSSKNDLDAEKKLNKKNEEIITLNKKINDVLTGGDSFPFVIFTIGNIKHSEPSIFLRGDYPLQNVTGRLVDVRKLRKEQRQGIFRIGGDLFFEKNVVSSAYTQNLSNSPITFDLSKGGRYLIHYFTPHNTFQQQIAIEINPEDGIPRQAYKIFKNHNEEPIYTHYPEGFPIPFDEIDFLELIPDDEMKEIKKKYNLN